MLSVVNHRSLNHRFESFSQSDSDAFVLTARNCSVFTSVASTRVVDTVCANCSTVVCSKLFSALLATSTDSHSLFTFPLR